MAANCRSVCNCSKTSNLIRPPLALMHSVYFQPSCRHSPGAQYLEYLFQPYCTVECIVPLVVDRSWQEDLLTRMEIALLLDTCSDVSQQLNQGHTHSLTHSLGWVHAGTLECAWPGGRYRNAFQGTRARHSAANNLHPYCSHNSRTGSFQGPHPGPDHLHPKPSSAGPCSPCPHHSHCEFLYLSGTMLDSPGINCRISGRCLLCCHIHASRPKNM